MRYCNNRVLSGMLGMELVQGQGWEFATKSAVRLWEPASKQELRSKTCGGLGCTRDLRHEAARLAHVAKRLFMRSTCANGHPVYMDDKHLDRT